MVVASRQELKFQIDWFKRQIFGAKSERFIPSDKLQATLELDIINKDEIDAIVESTIEIDLWVVAVNHIGTIESLSQKLVFQKTSFLMVDI